MNFEKSVSIPVKTFFFFLETTCFWAEKTFEFLSFPRNFVSIFGQTVWNWFNENSGQGRLHFTHSFRKAPPFSKSWLRACTCDNSAQWICDPPLDANSEPCQPSNNPSKFLSVFCLLMCEHISNTLLFYKSNFTELEAHFCSKFKNKLKTLPASEIKKIKIKQKRMNLQI